MFKQRNRKYWSDYSQTNKIHFITIARIAQSTTSTDNDYFTNTEFRLRNSFGYISRPHTLHTYCMRTAVWQFVQLKKKYPEHASAFTHKEFVVCIVNDVVVIQDDASCRIAKLRLYNLFILLFKNEFVLIRIDYVVWNTDRWMNINSKFVCNVEF